MGIWDFRFTLSFFLIIIRVSLGFYTWSDGNVIFSSMILEKASLIFFLRFFLFLNCKACFVFHSYPFLSCKSVWVYVCYKLFTKSFASFKYSCNNFWSVFIYTFSAGIFQQDLFSALVNGTAKLAFNSLHSGFTSCRCQ